MANAPGFGQIIGPWGPANCYLCADPATNERKGVYLCARCPSKHLDEPLTETLRRIMEARR